MFSGVLESLYLRTKDPCFFLDNCWLTEVAVRQCCGSSGPNWENGEPKGKRTRISLVFKWCESGPPKP